SNKLPFIDTWLRATRQPRRDGGSSVTHIASKRPSGNTGTLSWKTLPLIWLLICAKRGAAVPFFAGHNCHQGRPFSLGFRPALWLSKRPRIHSRPAEAIAS